MTARPSRSSCSASGCSACTTSARRVALVGGGRGVGECRRAGDRRPRWGAGRPAGRVSAQPAQGLGGSGRIPRAWSDRRWPTGWPCSATRTGFSLCSPPASRCSGSEATVRVDGCKAPQAWPRLRTQGDDEATRTTRPAGAYMMQEVQDFNEQLERIAEVAIVLVVGAMLAYIDLDPRAAVVRRCCCFWSCARSRSGSACSVHQSRATSAVDLMVRHPRHRFDLLPDVRHQPRLAGPLAEELIGLTLTMVAVSIVLHGISVTPLMQWYCRGGRNG